MENPKKQAPYARVVLLIVTLLSSLYFGYQLQYYSVDLYAGDSWHIVDVALNEHGLWNGFSHQHGPHRMGVAYLLYSTYFNLGITSASAHAYTQGALWLFSSLLALFISRKSRGYWTYADVIIPIVFLYPGLLMATIRVPYIHGFTVFFATAIIALHYLKRRMLRQVLTLVILFCAAFTFNSNLVVLAFAGFSFIRVFQDSLNRAEYLAYLIFIFALGMYLLTTADLDQSAATLEGSTSALGMLMYGLELTTNFVFLQAHEFQLWVGIVVLILSLTIWILPTVDSAKKMIHPRWILVALIMVYWTLNTYTRWSSGAGNAHAARYLAMSPLVLFALYWSSARWKYYSVYATGVVALFVVISWNASRQIVFPLRENKAALNHCKETLLTEEYEQCFTDLHPYPDRVHLEVSLKKLGYLP
ncbi:hypothetical protein [Phaeocystidibacter marisrubri]|uniref:Glycosyltransferase RgtA/B/C/D-like domain-containing protein n=1 Tax=Phaeocystidibacter marisrubri TaxID=1577780 RepID=A0A6L3ZDQ3_9FLAO|nr:hypothetical protein [Phaeocystidibacter marisrubri]KAB2815993.1 hypothetical protein F8C82_09875 [Phaeocystidibacter marisrubri]GGH66786.1 hypothetical protein GCM10011318_05100 [Phaeocystidibacter marisrubri]